MNQDTWNAVDEYYNDLLVTSDEALTGALRRSAAAKLPPISVAPNQGKMLHLIAKLSGAKRILEVGTLGGYSTIWLARALPKNGKLITLEYEPKHAAVAKENITAAKLDSIVEIRVGRAADLMADLAQQKVEPFDLFFIDADKTSTAEYFDAAMKLAKVGSVIIVDNVVRKGDVTNDASDDANVQGIRRFATALAARSGVTGTAVQTVGSKGYDGFVLARVEAI